MSNESLEYYKKVNEALMKKMGLAKKHLKDIQNEIEKIRSKRTTITKNKDLEDKDKKTKLSELISTSTDQIKYHVNALGSHLFNDEYSIRKYIVDNAKALRSEKESQLDEGLEMDFITADQVKARKEKWKESEEKTLNLMKSHELDNT